MIDDSSSFILSFPTRVDVEGLFVRWWSMIHSKLYWFDYFFGYGFICPGHDQVPAATRRKFFRKRGAWDSEPRWGKKLVPKPPPLAPSTTLEKAPPTPTSERYYVIWWLLVVMILYQEECRRLILTSSERYYDIIPGRVPPIDSNFFGAVP